MYANNWDAALTHNPGFWRLFAETAVSIFISYLTLACWSWTGGFVLGSLSRATSTLNSLLLCLILFFGQVIGAPDYFAFFRDRAFGGLHLPDVNAAVFEVGFYRVVLPVIVQIRPGGNSCSLGISRGQTHGETQADIVRAGLFAAATHNSGRGGDT